MEGRVPQPTAHNPRSAVWTPLVLAAAVLIARPAPSVGQPLSAPTSTTPWDAAILAGVRLGRPDEASVQGGYDEWFETPQLSVVVGRHVTPHLKAEVDLSITAEGQQFVQQVLTVPGLPYPALVASDRFTRVTALHGALVWQFLENQWAHPYVQIGVAASADRVRLRTWRQTVRISSGREPTEVVVAEDRADGPLTTREAGLVVGGGAKLYVTTRLFVRADTSLAAMRRNTHAAFRAGVGFDF
jgi:hypothetical protein